MELTAYVLDGHQLDIRPASPERDWMSASQDRFAYRCLPLNIANAYGWHIHSPWGFEAEWKGGAQLENVVVKADDGYTAPALSHFGGGTLTFHVPALFRTAPGYDLMVQGPVNAPKDGIAALSGIIETDWAPYTFTMNWIFTRPGLKIRFEREEPFCHLFPVKRGDVEACDPKYRKLSEAPEIKEQMDRWVASRSKLIEDIKKPGATSHDSWQKLYFRGLDPEGKPVEGAEHQTRLRVKPFKR